MHSIMRGSAHCRESLNDGRLPRNYYALGEQRAVDFGPDVLTLEIEDETGPKRLPPADWLPEGDANGGTLMLTEVRPKTRFEWSVNGTPPSMSPDSGR